MDNPELYSDNNKHRKPGVEEFINSYGGKLRNIHDGKEIALLDIGSGCGRILSEVFVGKSGLKFRKVIGIDKSEEMVNISNEKYGNDLISFQLMDAEKEIPENLKNLKFDLVTSFFSLPWNCDLNSAFQNVQTFLHPYGFLCCIILHVPKAIIQELKESKDDYVKHLIDFDNLPDSQLIDDPSKVIVQNLKNNRLEFATIIDTEDDEFVFDDLEAVKNFFGTFFPNLSLLSESEKSKLFEKLLTIFGMKVKDNKYAFGIRTITFVARKSPDFLL
ncbi:unnamed protein product [Chironomus riparius]|uniref:Methyltransferase domain-containing protein n=1 Tax=Chironomus riparius TaxID=315576 RepID=A0A9N9WVD4_9DIPT|nr:unnamed protein product [Chironomus riparius]